MNIWHDISPERIQPENFTAVIEIPKGGKNKYEMDKETGLLRLDRVLYTAGQLRLYPPHLRRRRRSAGCAGALPGVHRAADAGAMLSHRGYPDGG